MTYTSDAVRDVLAERLRQVMDEGYDVAHDDEHDEGELAQAAAAYALTADALNVNPEELWPWDDGWKPRTVRENLVRAGALILAEIERIDRARTDPRGGKP